MEKDIFYATFGCGQHNAGYVQRIVAKDYIEARKIMFNNHGEKWAFIYDTLMEVHEMDKRFGMLPTIGGSI